MDYPKLLIVGTEDVFSCNTSLSLTVRSFIDDWPSDRLLQVICGQGETSSSKYVLTNNDRLFYSFFSRKEKRTVSIKRNEAHFYQKKQSFKQRVRQFIVDIYMSLPYIYKKELKSIIGNYSPDIIYCCSTSIPVIHLAKKIAKEKEIPYIPHFFDDWPSNNSARSCFIKWYVPKLVDRIIHQAPTVLCISELMCCEYETRYDYHHFVPLMHSVYPLKKSDTSISSKKTLLYAGSIYLSRYKTLVELSKTIAKYGDSNIELVIFTNQIAWEEFKDFFEPYPFVRYGGFISQEELLFNISQTYGLVFVESFDEEMLTYTRLSMSTKIPEYLSSGCPILAMGNINQGSIEYLHGHDAAYLVTKIEDLQTTFSDFIERNEWDRISKNAANLFNKNHHREAQKERFREIMINSLNKHK